MSTYPEYFDYNEVTVTIEGKKEGKNGERAIPQYVISNIQTKGLPGYRCECHLEGLEISSALGTNNDADIGAKGTITLIDYRNSAFDALKESLKSFIQSGRTDRSMLPVLKINIKCFSGVKEWIGYVTSWSYQFAGSTPSLSLEWSCIPPAGGDVPPAPITGKYTPKGLIEALNNQFSGGEKIPFVDANGNDASDKIKFIDGDENGQINYDTSGKAAGQNPIVDGYAFILKHAMSIDDKPITGNFYDKKFIVTFKEPEDNADVKNSNGGMSKYVFVQNGSYAYYKPRSSDGRIVVPIMNFNYNATPSNLVLQSRVLNNMNGNIEQISQGNGSDSISTPDSNNGATNKSTAADSSATGVNVSFDCYNMISFSMLNTDEKIEYEIYDEHGNKSVVSGTGTVNSYKLSLQNGVVKASVSAVEYFNQSKTETKDTAKVGGEEKKESNEESSSDPETKNYVEYLREEDEVYVPLSLDRTEACLKSKDFDKHVTEFLDRYGYLKSTARRIDYSFIKKLIKEKDIGLLALLYGPAHYGIKKNGNEPFWWDNDDPVLHDPEHKKSKPWCAGDIGKLPYHYDIGGLGIAHWDSENLQEIYSTFGFSPDMSKEDQDHFSSLLLDLPKKEKDRKKFTGKITDWRKGEYKGHSRLFPIFTGKCYMRRFNEGLRQDSKWKSWAKDILYYDGPDGKIYQIQLFRMWIENFWLKTMSGLRGKPVREGHVPCLQDAVRISRAGNSRTGWIEPMCGKTVSEQYDIYESNGSKEHANKQKAYCKRLCQILMWEYNDPNGSLK